MARNPLSQLASLGEEALGKLAQNPTTHRAVQSALQLKDRVDDLSKRVRGLESMDKRFAAIERRLDKLEKSGGGSGSGSARKTGGASSKAVAPKTSGSKTAGSSSKSAGSGSGSKSAGTGSGAKG